MFAWLQNEFMFPITIILISSFYAITYFGKGSWTVYYFFNIPFIAAWIGVAVGFLLLVVNIILYVMKNCGGKGGSS